MARQKTCVHEREYKDSIAVDRVQNRGPIIMPKGSWCFQCDGDGKNGSWQPARKLRYSELKALQSEYFTEVDGEPLPSLALRRSWTATVPMYIDPEDIKAAEEVGRYIADEISKAFVKDFDSQFLGESLAETQSINRPERAKMSFQRATYTVLRNTRQVELKFESPITHFPTLDYSRFPPRLVPGVPPRKVQIDLEIPGDQDRVLIIVDEQEMKDFENFRKLKDVTARIKKVNAEIRSHEDQQERCERAAGKAYEEKSRLTREQQNLQLTSGVK